MEPKNKSSLKRKRLAIEDKVQIIKLSKSGSSVPNLSIQYGIGQQTVRDILKAEEKILKFVSPSTVSGSFKRRKSMKVSTWNDLDKERLICTLVNHKISKYL